MRSEKKLLLGDLIGKLHHHPCFLIADYQGMGAVATVNFRRQMRSVMGEFEVVRKRLFLKAVDEVYTSFDAKELTGHIGVIFAAHDPMEVIKKAFDFTRESGFKMRFLASRFGDKNLSAQQTEALSKLPNLQQLRAQLLSVFTGPASQTVGIFNALLASVPNCLEQKIKMQGHSS